MAGDMVVALGKTAIGSGTLFAHSSNCTSKVLPLLSHAPGRNYAHGEILQTQFVKLPQVRRTLSVLGLQMPGGWGYEHGINDQALAVGCTTHQSTLENPTPGLTGPELVRLALERCGTAQQAVDLVIDSIERYGQGRFRDAPSGVNGDAILLIADHHSAFVLEAAGRHWVLEEIAQARAASDVSAVQQNWNRISRGLASRAIENGWAREDGNKLDFAAALSQPNNEASAAKKRWQRASDLLNQQAGRLDLAFIRRLLADHFEETPHEASTSAPICQHGLGANPSRTAGSIVVQLGAEPGKLSPVWCAFGPPCSTVYFPLFLEGEIPAPFLTADEKSIRARVLRLQDEWQKNPQRWAQASEAIAELQARFDRETEEFLAEANRTQRDNAAELPRQVTNFMQHNLEQFLSLSSRLFAAGQRAVAPAATR